MKSIRAPHTIAGPLALKAWRTLLRRLYISRSEEENIVSGFHEAYLARRPQALWLGEPVFGPPLDLWIYQETVYDTRPDLVVAVETLNAGYLADLCEIAGHGEVLSVEAVDDTGSWSMSRRRGLTVVDASLEDSEVVEGAATRAAAVQTVMVVLGAQGGGRELERHLRLFGPLVSKGSYLIVENSGHPLRKQAISQFVGQCRAFVVDRSKEKFYLTFNSGGYLRRQR